MASASPVVPSTNTPCTPPLQRKSTIRPTAGSSSTPSAVIGVTMGTITPRWSLVLVATFMTSPRGLINLQCVFLGKDTRIVFEQTCHGHGRFRQPGQRVARHSHFRNPPLHRTTCHEF